MNYPIIDDLTVMLQIRFPNYIFNPDPYSGLIEVFQPTKHGDSPINVLWYTKQNTIELMYQEQRKLLFDILEVANQYLKDYHYDKGFYRK